MPLAANLVQVLYDIAHRMPALVSLAACVGFAFLLILYLSERRDVLRLRRFMEAAPSHPSEDLARSEALLDRAESELEELLGVAAPAARTPAAVGAGAAVGSGGPATAQTTAERPALEQVTTEREALLRHPRWHRFWGWLGQPGVLAIIVVGAVVLGVGGIYVSQHLLNGGGRAHTARRPATVAPQNVTVAVLNGTSVPGLGAKMAANLQAMHFSLGNVGNTRKEYDQTVVMYENGQRKAADEVAHALKVKPVQPIDRATQREAGAADVAVIAGKDRAP